MTSPLSVFLVTYNVADLSPPADFTRLLKLDSKELPNLYAIGLQELKHSPGSLLSDAFYDDPWTLKLTDTLCRRDYVRIKSVRLVGLHLVVFVRRSDLNYITNVESEVTATGFNGLWGNKGGVSIRMEIYGVNVCIVNCHLAAHQDKVANRIEDYDMIVENQDFRDPNTPTLLDHDYVFWMGDLNFRLDDLPKAEVERRIAERDLESLKPHDQLAKAMKEQLLLVDFEEGPITFAPTYRFNKGTDTYDTSAKQRKPAWCDRILWMVHEDAFLGTELSTHQMAYYSLPEYTDSDHKPVIGEFVIQVLSRAPELPILFYPLDTWLSSTDQRITYSIMTGDYEVHSKDWLALYTHTFTSPYDYTTWVWAPSTGDSLGDGSFIYEADFDKYYLRDLEGTYCLGYYSYKKNCLIGYSNTFRISAVDDSSSDDSDDNGNSLSGVKSRRKRSALHKKNKVQPLPNPHDL